MLIKPKHKNLINNFVSQKIIYIYIYICIKLNKKKINWFLIIKKHSPKSIALGFKMYWVGRFYLLIVKCTGLSPFPFYFFG